MKHAIGWRDLQSPAELARAKLGTRLCTHPQSTFRYEKFAPLRERHGFGCLPALNEEYRKQKLMQAAPNVTQIRRQA